MAQNERTAVAHFPTEHPYLAMMGLFLGTFVGMFSETSLNIALPQFMNEFSISAGIAQWMVVGYMLVIGIVLPFVGLLTKWYSAKKLTIIALAIFLVGSLISFVAPTFAILLSGRMIQGIGTGLLLPMTFAIAMEVFPPNKIGAAMGLTALIIMFAPVVGPTYSGLIIGMASWRYIFLTFAVILAVALVFASAFLVNPYKATKPAIDIPSCILSVVGFSGIVFGSCISSQYGWISFPVLASLLVGALSLVAFSFRQFKITNKMLNLEAFKIGGFTKGALLVMLNFGITLSSMYILPQYLQSGRSLSVSLAGLLMLPGGIINAVVAFLAGRLYDRYGADKMVNLGYCFSVIGAVMFLFVGTDSSILFIIACHVILMIGVPLAMSPAQTHALHSLPRHLGADGSTILNTLQQVMGAVSTAIATSLLGFGEHADSSGVSPQMFVGGTRNVFTFTLILALIGLLLSFAKVKEEAR